MIDTSPMQLLNQCCCLGPRAPKNTPGAKGGRVRVCEYRVSNPEAGERRGGAFIVLFIYISLRSYFSYACGR